MADSSNGKFVPDLPTNADRLLFVEDLLDYMKLQYPPNYVMEWDPRHSRDNIYYDAKRTLKNAFNRTVKKAFRNFENALKPSHEVIFRQIQEKKSVNSNTLERFAENLVADFPIDFHPSYLFIYCVILCKISVLFSMNGVSDARLLARNHILNFLQKYNILHKEWKSVYLHAWFYKKILQDAGSAPSLHSDEIEHNVQPQNAASGNQSNTSSRKKNVSSENKSNFQDQRKLECPINKQFLKKSLRRALDNLRDTGEIPSERNTSLFYLLKGVFRGRMRNAWEGIKIANYQAGLVQNTSIDKSVPDNTFGPGPSSAYQESAHVGKIDSERNFTVSLNAIGGKNSSKTLNINKDQFNIKSASNDGFSRTETSNTHQKSRSTCKTDRRKKLALSSDVKTSANYPSRCPGGNNLVNLSKPKNNSVYKAHNSDQMSVSSRRKWDFPSSNENVENLPPTRERSPILRDTIKNTLLERFSPPSSDHEESPPGKGKLKKRH